MKVNLITVWKINWILCFSWVRPTFVGEFGFFLFAGEEVNKMYFMKGAHPIRRTLNYLNNTKLVLKPFVQIFAVHYKPKVANHQGLEQFVYWHLCQLQYKNPNVQVITFKELTPTPLIRVFFTSGKELLMDVDRQSKDEIQNRVLETLCKTEAGKELKIKAKLSSLD